MRTCLAIAHSKSWPLAQAYDELCRREWHARAKRGEYCLMCCWAPRCSFAFALCAGDQDFDVNVASMRKIPTFMNASLTRRAITVPSPVALSKVETLNLTCGPPPLSLMRVCLCSGEASCVPGNRYQFGQSKGGGQFGSVVLQRVFNSSWLHVPVS